MDKKYYAHRLKNEPPEKWQPLEEHLRNVAEMAAEFAMRFGGEEWAGHAGQYHDIGKGTRAWQASWDLVEAAHENRG